MPVRRTLPFPWAPIFLLTTIFYLNFTSRVLLAPFMPVIEKDMGMGHGGAGSFFLFIALGYGVGLLGSGFVTSRLSHRLTIAWGIIMVGVALLTVSRLTSVGGMRFGLVIVGLFAGFYIPSGIATLTELASQEYWGKALAIHELGPNLGYVTVPLLAEGLLKYFSWREALAVMGMVSILMGVFFLFMGRGGRYKGQSLHWSSMRTIITSPPYWMMTALFTVSIGSSIGLYTMIPLFLVNEMGMERTLANPLIGFSRVFGIIILFCSGFFTDRFGPRSAMTFFLLTTGIFTLLFGAFHHPLATPVLMFLQAASTACLFPVGFTILSVVFPPRLRSTAISLVMVVGFSLGGGAVPSGLGHWAENFSFSSGFALLGVFFLLMLPFFLRVANRLEV